MDDSVTREEQVVQLIAENLPALQAYVMALMPGQPDVDDVIQDTCTLIWQKRGEFEFGTSFKAWMFSIAKFKVLSTWRDAKRRKEWVVPEETLRSLIDQGGEEPFRAIDVRKQYMRECVKALRTEDRSLILRRYLGESGMMDLANDEGRSRDSIRVSLHRIRGALRECIGRKLRLTEALS